MSFNPNPLLPLALLLGGLDAAAAIPCPKALRVAVFDYELLPLVSAEEPGKPASGKAIVWLHQALAATDCRPQLTLLRRPIIRGREELGRNEIDIWAIAYPGAEINRIGVLPMHGGQIDARLGYYKSTYSFYVLASAADISWDGRKLVGPPGLSVGMAPIPALREEAKANGWPVELGKNTPNVLTKLLSGRSQAALLPDVLMEAQPPEVQRKLQRLSPIAYVSWYYAVASHELGGQYPEFLRQFWLGFVEPAEPTKRKLLPAGDSSLG